ncbi:DUF6199 family natural product biosynthesis protein [Paenibacillus sp. FJAT-26967]|uniref:DUF6199 family natural product biosynthesis protein n=1 Tax=Paenibacillus sp. FJAT-26967 TaxID=1729690 RepID=UPI0008382888
MGLFLVLLGALMVFKAQLIWQLTEKWKSNDGTEPSDFYMLNTRVGGVIFTLVGSALFLVAILLG